MPYTTSDTASHFLRQFSPDEHGLVYRRYGRGQAYRVTEDQAEQFLARYMHDTRVARLLLIGLTIACGGGGGWLLAARATAPSGTTIVVVVLANVISLVAGFVWADLRNQTRPERTLSAASAPVACAIDSDEWTRAQLKQVPWINFGILPLVGLFIVWAFRHEVNLFAGWGRLMWLIPATCAALASVQAARKWRARRQR